MPSLSKPSRVFVWQHLSEEIVDVVMLIPAESVCSVEMPGMVNVDLIRLMF